MKRRWVVVCEHPGALLASIGSRLAEVCLLLGWQQLTTIHRRAGMQMPTLNLQMQRKVQSTDSFCSCVPLSSEYGTYNTFTSNSGLGVQVKVLKPSQVVPSLLGSGADNTVPVLRRPCTRAWSLLSLRLSVCQSLWLSFTPARANERAWSVAISLAVCHPCARKRACMVCAECGARWFQYHPPA